MLRIRDEMHEVSEHAQHRMRRLIHDRQGAQKGPSLKLTQRRSGTRS
jgi:hypothetical protein